MAAILEELKKQKELWEYAEFRGKWAFLASVITNAAAAIVSMFSKRKPKLVNPDDFLDKKWRKKVESMFKEAQPSPTKDEWASFIEEAKAKGLKGPW